MAGAVASDEAPVKKAGPSLVVQIVVLLVLSAIAAGAGLFTGQMLNPGASASAGKEEAAQAGGHGSAKDSGKGHGDAEANPGEAELKRGVVALTPVMTNLAAPADTWIRLELAAVFDGPPDMTVADAIQQDVVAFIRTVKLHQMEGASGFQHLKEDMNERAAMRSGGTVKQLLVRTMLIE